jgi:hypothetical protein
MEFWTAQGQSRGQSMLCPYAVRGLYTTSARRCSYSFQDIMSGLRQFEIHFPTTYLIALFRIIFNTFVPIL